MITKMKLVYDLNLIKCPACGGNVSSRLICRQCGYKIKVQNDIWVFDEFLTDNMRRENDVNKKDIKKTKNLSFSKYYSKCILNSANWHLANDIIRRLIKTNVLNKDAKFLELGCAYGWLTYMVSKHTNNTYKTDISYEYLNKLKTPSFLIPMQNIDKIIKPNSFDIIWANAAIHHCPDLDAVFKSIKSILKKNGLFILSNELITGLWEKNKKNIEIKNAGCQDMPYHLHNYFLNANKYFTVRLFVPNTIIYYFLNPEKIPTSYKRKIFFFMKKLKLDNIFIFLLKFKLFQLLYLISAELFGAHVLIFCKNNKDKSL